MNMSRIFSSSIVGNDKQQADFGSGRFDFEVRLEKKEDNERTRLAMLTFD